MLFPGDKEPEEVPAIQKWTVEMAKILAFEKTDLKFGLNLMLRIEKDVILGRIEYKNISYNISLPLENEENILTWATRPVRCLIPLFCLLGIDTNLYFLLLVPLELLLNLVFFIVSANEEMYF